MSIASSKESARREVLDTIQGFNGKLSHDRWASLALAAFPSVGLTAGQPPWLAAAIYLASLAACGAAFAVATYFTFGVKVGSDEDLEDLCDRKDFGHVLASAALGLAFAAYLAGIAAFAWARP